MNNRPPRPRRKTPIDAFGPEIMATLLAGAKAEVRIPLPYRDAVQFRRRVHSLRARMREESHPNSKLVERARVVILVGSAAGFNAEPETRRTAQGAYVPSDLHTPAIVLLKPYDEEFSAAIRAAGIKVDTDDVGESILDGLSTDPLASFDPLKEGNQ